MAAFEYETLLDHPRDAVFAWFERPGALYRLSPPFGGSVLSPPSDGIRVGSTAVIGIGVPGVLGAGLGAAASLAASLVPGLARLTGRSTTAAALARAEVSWTARHTALETGRMFRDEMVSGPLGRWVHTHTFEDAPGGGTLMRDHIDYAVPAERFFPGHSADTAAGLFRKHLRRIFDYRAEQVRADLAFHAAHIGAGQRTVAVSGASGMIGTQLCALLSGGGHKVLRLVRRPPRTPDEIFWNPADGAIDASALRGCDAVVNLAGRPIGGRFTEAAKQEILRSRTEGTGLLARTLAELAEDDGRLRAFVCASGIHYYGSHPHERTRQEEAATGKAPGTDDDGAIHYDGAAPAPLREDAPAGDGFLATVCRAWEAAAEPAERAGVRVVKLRTGIVQSPAGGVLERMLPLFAAGAGGPLLGPDGSDPWQSWISIEDVVGAYAHAVLDDSVEGTFNAVAPAPVTASEYARTLGRVLHRPAAIPVPGFGPKLLLGEEGARELASSDLRIDGSKLAAAGYVFRYPELEGALGHLLP